ncbi:class F sortase [Kribbella lupini]|uniref:class F sortase n=1 Tax=Kribbella lupini TaxID=291602 RepID=UPI0031D084D8
MSHGKRRGRPAPLRRGGLVALAGLLVVGTGVYLQFGQNTADAGADRVPTESCAPADRSVERGGDQPAAARAAGSGTALRAEAGSDPCSADGPAQGNGLQPSESATAKAPGVGDSSAHPSPSATPGLPSARKPPAVPPRPGRPSRISLGQLGITAPVVPIKADGGELTPPSDPTTVGWWSAGARPGAARGSAVITGHTVHDGGGAFDDLDRLTTGSIVTVTTSRGVLRYQVSGVTTYRKRTLAAAAGRLFDQRGEGRLVLVTCEDWNGEVYLSNVVVVARRIA